MKKNRIAKKQEARWNRESRKQDKLLIWEKSIFRSRRPYYRTRAGYGMAGIPRRIQKDKACKMMQPIWSKEAARCIDPWSWRV